MTSLKKTGEGGLPRKTMSEGRIYHHQDTSILKEKVAAHQLCQRTFSPIQLQNKYSCLNPSVMCNSYISRSKQHMEMGPRDQFSAHLALNNGPGLVQSNISMGLGMGSQREAQICPVSRPNFLGGKGGVGFNHNGLGLGLSGQPNLGPIELIHSPDGFHRSNLGPNKFY